MKCPLCKELTVSFVEGSKRILDDTAIYRNRICKGCGGRFSTREKINDVPRGRPKRKDEVMVA